MNQLDIFRKFLVAGIFAFLYFSGFTQNKIADVQQKVTAWQTVSGLTTASIGVEVSDSKTGEVLIHYGNGQSLVPASILKLVTTATALEIFGPDFRFQTVLAHSGIIRNDTLFGDLQIIGGGDPTLGSAYFPENIKFITNCISDICKKDIRVILGNLILDGSIYEQQTIPNTWIWEDIGNYYGAGAAGISVYDNQYEIHLKSERESAKSTQLIGINPVILNLNLQNEVLSSDSDGDHACVFGSPMDNRRVIRGTIPKNRTDFVVKASVPDPAVLFASEFRKELVLSGIVILGDTKYEKVNVIASNRLSIIQSPSLFEIIRITNHQSVNLFAEHFLKHLAFNSSGLGTTADGCKFVTEFWKNKGIDMTGFFMNDGSGLSRFNAVTASQVVEILNFMKNKSINSTMFYNSLPTAGSGTLTVFKTENFPNQSLHAKSGSMTRVRCYAGYLTTASGRQLSFAFMLNNFS